MTARIGFTSVTFRSLSAKEVCETAVKNGIKYIEWGADVHVPSPDEAKKVRALCDTYGIESISFGSYYRVGDGDFAGFERDCRSAQILGAGRIRIWLGRRGSADCTEKDRAELVSMTRILAGIAEQYALTLAFEFHGKTLNDNGRSCMSFLNELDRPGVMTYWQPLAYAENLTNLLTVMDRLTAVHVFSWDDNNVRYPLDAMENEWKIYIGEIAAQKDVDYILEFVKDDSPQQFAADVRTLKRLTEGK